jgi:hypothetical protein
VFGVKNRPYFQVLKIGLFSGLKNRPFFGGPEKSAFLAALKIGPHFRGPEYGYFGGPEKTGFLWTVNFHPDSDPHIPPSFFHTLKKGLLK